jgi:hypothetical protein
MRKALIALVLAVGAAAGRADVLLIDGVETDAQSSNLRPGRGLTMDRVEATYGAPSSRHAAVGDPPITRWDYPGFSVYFEYDKVLHSAVRR